MMFSRRWITMKQMGYQPCLADDAAATAAADWANTVPVRITTMDDSIFHGRFHRWWEGVSRERRSRPIRWPPFSCRRLLVLVGDGITDDDDDEGKWGWWLAANTSLSQVSLIERGGGGGNSFDRVRFIIFDADSAWWWLQLAASSSAMNNNDVFDHHRHSKQRANWIWPPISDIWLLLLLLASREKI